MKTRALLALGLSTLACAGTMTALVGEGGSVLAGNADATKLAQKQFNRARAALAGGRANAAVTFAEAAVAYDPAVVAYRMVLGQAYLKAGRFTSARAAFGDVLMLDPNNGKAALHVALAEIAEGNWDGARHTLDANAATIPVSDRGLAMALAGDPGGAVDLLGTAVRAPDADAKTRQNFALALALAGRWSDAKTVAAMDVAPGDLDARILQWAAFANPKSASDQVASLLGVTPMVDPGQPVALALNGTRNVAVAATAAAPVDTFMPKPQPEAVAIAADMGTPVAPAAAPAPIMASVSSVSFAPRREIVQMLPPRATRAVATRRQMAPGGAVANAVVATSRSAAGAFVTVPRTRYVVAAKPKPAPVGAAVAAAKGKYVVQLGAYDNAAVARDAWGRASRASSFAGHAPSGMQFAGRNGNFYRLSVGSFARQDAEALCRSYRAKGGNCFVRTNAGDSAASWTKAPVKVAAIAPAKPTKAR